MPAIMGAIKPPVPPAAPVARAGADALVLSRNGTAEAGWGSAVPLQDIWSAQLPCRNTGNN